MESIMIIGTGLYTPKYQITNDELVTSFNLYADQFNKEHENEIKNNQREALQYSSTDFIFKASGIKSRFVLNKDGVLDPKRMAPLLPPRQENDLSYQAEMAIQAAQNAISSARILADKIDLIICACSNFERPYPAISIEIQNSLNAKGIAFDMNVACSSATFAIKMGMDYLRCNNARYALIVCPEICSAHLNFSDRDSHFIFGDACTAVLLEKTTSPSTNQYEILSSKLMTKYSNHIRNNFGFLSRHDPQSLKNPSTLFHQQGKKVFKEVVPLVSNLIIEQLKECNIDSKLIKKMWLHQANIHMNEFIFEKIMGYRPDKNQAPSTLSEYANTSSAGSIISFHLTKDELKANELGLICSFGAGLSAGSLIIKAC